MQKLNAWVENTRIYPPSEMFYQADSKQAKAEKRIVSICEELYVFTCTTLSDMRAAYTELSMAVRMGISDMRQVYVEEICGKTAFHIDNAVKALDTMHKRDPLLQAYYKEWSCKSKDLKDEIKSTLINAFPGVDKSVLLSNLQYWYDKESEK
ncbi:hypothetical protein [Klebsiella phage phiKp_21]|uniref:Uncharacterized protein n=1 Tax=Klebsiella phage vB_KleM_RaK2 TaxID=1147094 RepID=H6X449_9CAUD|nr:hypothetical protein F403_gp293 [Klebsiella phage vB_KleM_RaK2]AFA44515.1 hypothetical protein RaK2_00242 [Klebsiella phage vB_KleM_RaK2]QOE32654.1 hypothetical protein CPT_Muenster_488 [Klebsiella phage Muenster]BEH88462.1 hypothetical protein [Klebsiella phage phiKp_21]